MGHVCFRAFWCALTLCLFTLVTGLAVKAAQAASYGLVLPGEPVVTDPKTRSLRLVLSLVDPFAAKGVPLEQPQAFTAFRHLGDELARSEHLSVLEETTAFGAPAWQTEIALPHPGVYHFLLNTKAVWLPDQDRFVQYSGKVLVPVFDSDEGWDKPLGEPFEIVPLTRPFGLCTGMAFEGQVLLAGKAMPDALVRVVHLKAELTQNRRRIPPSPWHEEQVVKSDAAGRFAFTCPQPGWWGFAVGSAGDPLQGPDGQLKPLENCTVFWVYMDPCKERISK